ncbi:hypothetical protein [Paenibacillus chitinolyticus]|uniref:hypothetical protein n=1 Tax=Paenibacillus chitinolyticus TaxID=79263 RepID=UPI003D06C044
MKNKSLPFPVGYRFNEDGHLEVNPNEAARIKLIFDLSIEGLYGNEIEMLLKEFNIPKRIDPSEPTPIIPEEIFKRAKEILHNRLNEEDEDEEE